MQRVGHEIADPALHSEVLRIDTPSAFRELLHACEDSPLISFDIESNGFYHYRERTCILTVSLPAGHFVVDSLALWDLMPELAPSFSSAEVVSLCHGGSYDVTSLKRDFGFEFRTLRDTHIASSMLGREGTGLASLVLKQFGVELPKELQKHDWTRRPITNDQLTYLAGDTRFLPALADTLHGEIEEKDLIEEYLIECDVLAALPAANVLSPGDGGFRRIRNVRDLNDRQRTVLQAACAVRDAMAHEMDLAPFRVAGNEVLVRVALSAINAEVAEGTVSGVNRNCRDEFRERAQAAIRNALQGPPPSINGTAAYDGPRITRQEMDRRRAVERKLKGWRNAEATRRGIGIQAVLPTPVLEEIVRERDWDETRLLELPRLGAKRIERYAADLIRIAAST